MEPQTPIDVQRILDRKRKRAEYDKQRKLKRKNWLRIANSHWCWIRILYRVTCIRLVCKTYPWSNASTIRQKLYNFFGHVHCPSTGITQHCIQAIGTCHASSVGVYKQTPKETEWQILIACIQSWDTPDDKKWTFSKHLINKFEK
jgi:hypothetical protein